MLFEEGAMVTLTAKQKRLRVEIEEIASVVQMDHWNITTEYAPKLRTTFLELTVRKLVLAQVMSQYTFIDECLTTIICRYYFRGPEKDETFKGLWRTKKFRIFNHRIMDELYLQKKLEIVKEIRHVPKDIGSHTMAINDLRNAVD
jgi:hypothetical protein